MRNAPTTFNRKGDIDYWPGCSWVVTTRFNSRFHATILTAVCKRTNFGVTHEGTAESAPLGPFDDLQMAIREALIDSAIAAVSSADAARLARLAEPVLPGFD